MKFYCSTLVTLALMTGCGGAQFKQAIPHRESVRLNVPQAQGQALLAGEASEAYQLTLGIATSINVPVLAMFDVIEAITNSQPTTQTDTSAVWGPSDPQGLERLSYRFTVDEVAGAARSYTYKLEARVKDATAQEDFVVVFEGAAQPGEDNDGTGSLTWHFGSRRNLVRVDCDVVGDIVISYDVTTEPRALDVVFTQVANECAGELPHDAHYTYTEALDRSGSMDFAIETNIHAANENKPENELVAVRSRWTSEGAGRGDMRISGGEVDDDLARELPNSGATSVDLLECWDASFISTHVDTNPDALEAYLNHANSGDAASCPFADAQFAEL